VTIERTDEALRCAEHPGRPAHDRCPRCNRPRCDADAGEYAALGCGVCHSSVRQPRTVGLVEVLVRAGLASLPVALIGGWIATQYVYDHIFSLVVPGLVGLTASWVASAAVPRRQRTSRWLALTVAAVAGLLGTALGFHLLPGGRQSVLRPFSVVGAPYLCALIGTALWPVLFGAPKAGASSPAP
jgi:hypothetical protein